MFFRMEPFGENVEGFSYGVIKARMSLAHNFKGAIWIINHTADRIHAKKTSWFYTKRLTDVFN